MNQIMRVNKKMQGYYRRGAAYLAMGKFKEALKDFQQVGFLPFFFVALT